MIVLKIAQTDGGLALLLSPEAQEFLGAVAGHEVSLGLSDDGDLVLAAQDISFEARRARGRAFLKRYEKTFQALAK
jgi:hypothetical protein